MLFVAYDFEDDHKRGRFANFLKKYGRKIQYSVYEIRNSQRVLQNILSEIELKYKKSFSGADSVIIFYICEACQKRIKRYGYSQNEEEDVVIFR
jgi:CRISPR-associated protein Cas2